MKKFHIRNVLVIILVVAVTALIAGVIILNPESVPLPGINQNPAQTQAPTGVSDPAQTGPDAQTEPQPVVNTIAFPIALENGKLEIESLFSYTGLNPDADNADVSDSAAIVLVNRSGEYMAEARITMVLTNGDVANFVATDLPAGKRVMVFCADGAAADNDTGCVEVHCEAVFDPDASMEAERIAVSVDGMTVTVENLTGNEIPELVIYCRCPLGEEYFGGITYQYQVNSLPANGTATVDAWDCVLGMAEVVRIEINE